LIEANTLVNRTRGSVVAAQIAQVHGWVLTCLEPRTIMFTESYAYGTMCVSKRVSGYFSSNRRLNATSFRLLSVYQAP